MQDVILEGGNAMNNINLTIDKTEIWIRLL